MKKYLTLGLVSLLSFLAGKYLFPPQPQIKEVVRTVQVEKKQKKEDKVVKSTKIKKPDGTVVTETTVTSKTDTTTDKTSQSERRTETKSSSKLTLGLLAIKNVSDFGKPFEYGATLAVPVFGNVKAQGLVTTDKRLGLGLALEF